MSLEHETTGQFSANPHDRGMKTIMNLDNLTTITQMADFLAGSQAIAFGVASTKDERYCLVERALKRFNYPRLKRDEKGIVIQFLMKLSRYSRQQLTRMIGRFCEKKKLKRYQRTTQGFTVSFRQGCVT